MSSAIRHSLWYVEEETAGTTPTSPEWTPIRYKTCSPGITKAGLISEEMKANRQIGDFRHGARQGGGNIEAELSYGTFDTLLEAVLCGTWAAKFAPYVAATISAAASDNSINDSAGAFPVYQVGDRITIAGFTGTVGNNATVRVVSRTANKIIVSGVTLVDDAAGESVTITSITQKLTAGTTRRQFSILRKFEDQDSGDKPFHVFKGVEFNTLGLSFKVETLLGLSLGFVARDMDDPAETEPSGSTYAARTTTKAMDVLGAIVAEGGAYNYLETYKLGYATELSATVENGLKANFVIGKEAVDDFTIGMSNASGQLVARFKNATLLQKFLDKTATSVEFIVGDSANNIYRFKFPSIVYNGGQPDVSGAEDLVATYPWQATEEAATETQIVIERVPVA